MVISLKSFQMNSVFMPNTMTLPAFASGLRHSSLRVYWTLRVLSAVLTLSVVSVVVVSIITILRSVG